MNTSINNFAKYYNEIFPISDIFEVLEINENREITFTTHNGIYIRYQSFSNLEEFKSKITEINPSRIDIGAEFDSRPMKLSSAKPIKRELVFDIDLTDYPRTCCDSKTVCELCFNKIKCAVKLLDYILREEFGFKRIGFVFSGRRGVHCWVFDYPHITSNIRNDIYKYFQSVIDKNLSIAAYNKIISEYSNDDENYIKDWFIRIDKNVTTAMNHLLKMPFSIHPDSHRISVPLDSNNLPDLSDLPMLEDVIADPSIIDQYTAIMRNW